MNEQKDVTPFVFYLSFGESLPRSFYAFDRQFKDLGYILVPIKLDQLQSLSALSDQQQIAIISSVSDSSDYKTYNEKVRPLLKFVLKSKRINFFCLSSFSKLNDSKIYSLQKNYYFMKYPLDAKSLAFQICDYLEVKGQEKIRWPGGRRSSATGIL